MSTPLSSPLLFITRVYPPVIGGMENLSFDLTTTISSLTEAYIIKNIYGKKALPFFIPFAFLKAIYFIITKKIKIVHLSDGVLAPVGFLLKIIFPKLKVVANVHGLDLTYAEKLPLYYYTNILPLRRLDLIIPVSQDTEEECLKYGISEDKISYIPNGTHSDKYYKESLKENSTEKKTYFKKLLPEISGKIDFSADFLILFLGRLAKRKGMFWFTGKVLPKLPAKTKLIIAGDGPDRERIEELVQTLKLQDQVFLLGKVNEKTKKFLLNACNTLVMPNIKVPGDKEGFGITAIEAGACALPPVVSDIEGLKNAIENKKNGLRIPEKNTKKYIEVLKFLMENPDYRKKLAKDSRTYVKNHFDWKVVGEKYMEEFGKMEE